MARKPRIHAAALQYFDMVRRCRSIREASRRLNVVSSAVNRQILKLEDELGAALFERLPGGLRLTAAGELLARHVSLVLDDADRLHLDLQALREQPRSHVEIASIEGLTRDLLPQVLGQLRERCPWISVGVTHLGSQAIAEAVHSGQADIGIGFALPACAALRPLLLAHFRLGAVVAGDHPLAAQPHASLADCARHGLILAKPELSIRHALAPWLDERTPPLLETDSMELARQLARRNLGVAVQTRIGLEADLASGALRHLPLSDGGGLHSGLGLYVQPARTLPNAVTTLAEQLGEAIGARAAADALMA